MALMKFKSCPTPSPLTIFSLFQLLLLVPLVKTTSFNYTSFSSNFISQNITLAGDAAFIARGIQLTTNRVDVPLDNSTGRAFYAQPVRIWDSATGHIADFTTRFSFAIIVPADHKNNAEDGLAFFLTPNGSYIPPYSYGSSLGLFNESSKFNSVENPVVAVEFDTFPNLKWDPCDDHIGIYINSIDSIKTWGTSSTVGLKQNDIAHAWVSYIASTKKLSVYFSYQQTPEFDENFLVVSYVFDITKILPEWINVGFSAATGCSTETHNLVSWYFVSTEFPSREFDAIETPSPSPSPLASKVYSPKLLSSSGTGKG